VALFGDLTSAGEGRNYFQTLKTKAKALHAGPRKLAGDWRIEKSTLHRIRQAVVCSCTGKDSPSLERSIFCSKLPDIVGPHLNPPTKCGSSVRDGIPELECDANQMRELHHGEESI
jgi:hypothetical protein